MATTQTKSVVVIGAGSFGASTALEYAKHNHKVTLLEQYNVLDNRISSTDFNRIIRSDYRGDKILTDLAEKALSKWKQWGLFHQHGQLILSQNNEMKDGNYFTDQFNVLQKEDPNRVKLLSFKQIGNISPAWIDDNNYHKRWKKGFISTNSGWVYATKGLQCIINQCQENNVDIRENVKVNDIQLIKRNGNKAIIDTNDGKIIADLVILTCGVWLPTILNKLNLPSFPYMKPTSNLCGYFKVKDDKNKWLFESNNFPNFLADIEETGYYGFALNEGYVKIAQHELFNADPKAKYMNIRNKFEMIKNDEKCDSNLQFCKRHLLNFVANEFPFGKYLELDYFDLCYYNVADDHDFLIDFIPGYKKVVAVAGAGSGHSFKFAPILGQVVRECLTNSNAFNGRFQWKPRNKVDFFGGSGKPERQSNIKNQLLQSKL